MNETQLRQAMARAYCTPENEKKDLDATLIEAMIKEILSIPLDGTAILNATEFNTIIDLLEQYKFRGTNINLINKLLKKKLEIAKNYEKK